MSYTFARRTWHVQRSFIREILKVTNQPDIISFAGGLPDPHFFPIDAIAEATARVFAESGHQVLQYSNSEGYLPLREYIAARYWQKFRLHISPEEILITNGSQQGLDLIAKVLLNPGDAVVIEQPGYLGAIQAFSFYEPTFYGVALDDDGPDVAQLAAHLNRYVCRLMYGVPNFQNPSGITWSADVRQHVAELLTRHGVLMVEDDPYGELRFIGETHAPLSLRLGRSAMLLGSFSKIIAPGLRLGWVCATKPVMEKLLIAKQASDLHSNYLAQRILYEYLREADLDAHIDRIRQQYGQRRDCMIRALQQHLPAVVRYTLPEGGMFIWLTLPENLSAMRLFELAMQRKVAFVPGQAFYTDGGGQNTLRLNFSNASAEQIEKGISHLGQAILKLLSEADSVHIPETSVEAVALSPE